MKILSIAILLLCVSIMNSQNVKFHESIDKHVKELEKAEKQAEKASKDLKKIIKSKEVEDAKGQANSSYRGISKIGDYLKKAGRAYKDAKKEAKVWGCENTVELMDKKNINFQKLVKTAKDAENEISDASKQKKLKKVQSRAKSTKDILKDVLNEIKKFKNEIEIINESCS